MDNAAVRAFFDAYGEKEWERLDTDVYRRVMFLLHMDFIHEQVRPGMRVLDAGCGAGRYAIALAALGCRVTLFDLSDAQLAIAREKIDEAGCGAQIDGLMQGDIRDLSAFDTGAFDLVLCYGAPLSYVLQGREQAMAEMLRVLRPGGTLAASVNNRWGILKDLLGRSYQDFFDRPDYWYIPEVVQTGDLPVHEQVNHPARHFFEADELAALLAGAGFAQVELGACPCLMTGSRAQVNALCESKAAYDTLLDIERRAYRRPTMVDNGEFLLVKGTKPQTPANA